MSGLATPRATSPFISAIGEMNMICDVFDEKREFNNFPLKQKAI
jgi:hypothetical protein